MSFRKFGNFWIIEKPRNDFPFGKCSAIDHYRVNVGRCRRKARYIVIFKYKGTEDIRKVGFCYYHQHDIYNMKNNSDIEILEIKNMRGD